MKVGGVKMLSEKYIKGYGIFDFVSWGEQFNIYRKFFKKQGTEKQTYLISGKASLPKGVTR